jgi:hypothetical protein
MVHHRFIDIAHGERLHSKSGDFFKRKHRVVPTRLFFSFVVFSLLDAALVTMLVAELIYLPNVLTRSVGEMARLLGTSGILMAAVIIVSCLVIDRARNIVSTAEFQSLLFSSSMRLGTKFCAIVNQNKTIVYYDENFATVFKPAVDYKRDFDHFISHSGFKDAARKKIDKALKTQKSAEAKFTFNGEEWDVTIESLGRPGGYFFVKAV